MAEAMNSRPVRMPVPLGVSQEWLDTFNSMFSDGNHSAQISTEDWLEQPVGEIGSAYYNPADQLGPTGWSQTINGRIEKVAYTNLPPHAGKAFGNVLALAGASLQLPDGETRPLAADRLVLIRLDRVSDGIIISRNSALRKKSL